MNFKLKLEPRVKVQYDSNFDLVANGWLTLRDNPDHDLRMGDVIILHGSEDLYMVLGTENNQVSLDLIGSKVQVRWKYLPHNVYYKVYQSTMNR